MNYEQLWLTHLYTYVSDDCMIELISVYTLALKVKVSIRKK